MDIQLGGQLNEQGMVLDFGIVKRQAKDYVDTCIDHCLVVPTAYDGCDITDNGDRLVIDFDLANGGKIHHASVSSAVSLIDAEAITTETAKNHG